MRRNIYPIHRMAASIVFLLIIFALQGGKLLHAFQHTDHEVSHAHSAPVEKKHGSSFNQAKCIACEFDYCRDALPASNSIEQETDAAGTMRFVPPTASVNLPSLLFKNRRGPPSC